MTIMSTYIDPTNGLTYLATSAEKSGDSLRSRRLSEHLFEATPLDEEELRVYAIIDGANCPDLLDKLYLLKPEFLCLYRGELASDVAECAPYLIRLEPNSLFTLWLLKEGWGKSWGIFALASIDLRSIRRHLCRYLMVYDPKGRPLYFRYYDPRVFRVYLPTCNAQETRVIFGPIKFFIMEDQEPMVMLRFRPDGATPKQESHILQSES